MCATGEVAVGLAQDGLRVTAVDIEPEMIATGKRNSPDDTNPCFVVGDVRDLCIADRDYVFAFIGTGDFHHLLLEREMETTLLGIRNHLRDRGCLTLDLVHPGGKSWRSPKRRFDQPSESQGGSRMWRIAEASYDAYSLREHIKQEVFVEQHGNVETFLHEFDLQLVSRPKPCSGCLKEPAFK